MALLFFVRGKRQKNKQNYTRYDGAYTHYQAHNKLGPNATCIIYLFKNAAWPQLNYAAMGMKLGNCERRAKRPGQQGSFGAVEQWSCRAVEQWSSRVVEQSSSWVMRANLFSHFRFNVIK